MGQAVSGDLDEIDKTRLELLWSAIKHFITRIKFCLSINVLLTPPQPMIGMSTSLYQFLTFQRIILESLAPVIIRSSSLPTARAQTLSSCWSRVFTHSLFRIVHSFSRPSEPLDCKPDGRGWTTIIHTWHMQAFFNSEPSQSTRPSHNVHGHHLLNNQAPHTQCYTVPE